MPVLIIGETERAAIAELRAFAAATPQDIAGRKAAADRDIAAFRDAARMHGVLLPGGYSVVYSHEIQPNAPPPGLCHHISIGVNRPGWLPTTAAVETILAEFGMGPLNAVDHLYIEDISSGEKAVNIIQLIDRSS